ncbi:MAG: cyclopropane-fatty-acyl-phospholipid synthase family protein [Singulisphaera sp.]
MTGRTPMASSGKTLSLVDRLLCRLAFRGLTQVTKGTIHLHDYDALTKFGGEGALQATVQVHEPRLYRDLVLGGSLGAAAAYVRGEWDCDDLTALFRILLQNQTASEHLDGLLSRLSGWIQRGIHRWHANTKSGSHRNIHAHYDLGNDFFRLWLDDTWAYSCGIFDTPAATLEEASLEKFDRVCRKLALAQDDSVLEIGAGWGGFALHAAQRYGCRVTTTTISAEQFEFARQRMAGAGVADRVTLLRKDYRDLAGKFDKLVSLEMIEAVGHEYLNAYFAQCAALLRPEGSLLLQAIVMPERGYKRYLRTVDFIRRYVFPGGCLPSVSSILDAVGRTGRLRLVHLEDMAPHYAETLRRWRANFRRRVDEVRGLGYSAELIRLWDYYLCYCEAAFEERHVGVVQMVFDNDGCRRDPLAVGQAASLSRNESLSMNDWESDHPQCVANAGGRAR